MTAFGSETLNQYQYRGVRSLVLLHAQEMRRFVETWRAAKEAGVALDGFEDPNYDSLNTLLVHVLWWARYYATWSCENLGLADPEIGDVPQADEVEGALERYLDHLLVRWNSLFGEVPAEPFIKPQFLTRWGASLPIEHLLEHAVVHPMRHRLQLLELAGDC